MTDRDPAARRQTPSTPAPGGPASGGPPARGGSTTGSTAGAQREGTGLKDRWWWTSTLRMVVGLVVAGYQLEPLRSPDALWANWVIAALGLAVAVHGAVGLLRAYRAR